MTTVAGASRYLAAATLANVRGISPSTPTVLGDSGSAVSLLEAGRNSANGIGLSARARALNDQFLSSTASSFNSIFSLSAAELSTEATIAQKILAIRASIPESQLAPSLRGDNLNEEV